MLIANARGNYSFLKGLGPFSSAVTARGDFEIEHVRFAHPPELSRGFDRVERHLRALGRPLQALCGMELRCPKPYSFQGFAEFNKGYVEVLKGWEIFLDGLNPVARTNVVPDPGAPAGPALYAFSYTVPARGANPSFVIAGSGEIPEGSLDPHQIVRPGDTSADAIAEKARFVFDIMDARLKAMGLGWDHVSVTQAYTVHNALPVFRGELFGRMGLAAAHGLTWFSARPPVTGVEFEMDARACRREIVIEE